MIPLTAEQRRLAAEFWPTAQKLAQRTCRLSPTRYSSDCAGAAADAVVQAALRHDPARGASFRTFANYTIVGMVKNALRDWIPGVKTPGVPRPPALSMDDVVDSPQLVTSGYLQLDAVAQQQMAAVWSAAPRQDHRRVLRERFFDDLSVNEIAARRGYSKQRASEFIKEAMAAVRRARPDLGDLVRP